MIKLYFSSALLASIVGSQIKGDILVSVIGCFWLSKALLIIIVLILECLNKERKSGGREGGRERGGRE